MIRLLTHPLTPSLISNMSLCLPAWRLSSLLTGRWRGGRGGLGPRESLLLYKSFNTLWLWLYRTWEGEVLNGLMSRVRCRLLFFLRHENSHAQLFQTYWKGDKTSFRKRRTFFGQSLTSYSTYATFIYVTLFYIMLIRLYFLRIFASCAFKLSRTRQHSNNPFQSSTPHKIKRKFYYLNLMLLK